MIRLYNATLGVSRWANGLNMEGSTSEHVSLPRGLVSAKTEITSSGRMEIGLAEQYGCVTRLVSMS
jgi:hypothetical protein